MENTNDKFEAFVRRQRVANANRGPGRPPIHGEKLMRREILVHKNVDAEIGREAKERAVSIGEVYREWIERGRNAKG